MPKDKQPENDLTKLSAELAEIEQGLSTQRAEKHEIEKKLELASQSGDFAARKNLRQKIDALDASITRASERSLRVATAKREAELPAVEADCQRLTQVLADKQAKLSEASAEHEKANFAFFDAQTRVRLLQSDIAVGKREIAKQDAEAARRCYFAGKSV